MQSTAVNTTMSTRVASLTACEKSGGAWAGVSLEPLVGWLVGWLLMCFVNMTVTGG